MKNLWTFYWGGMSERRVRNPCEALKFLSDSLVNIFHLPFSFLTFLSSPIPTRDRVDVDNRIKKRKNSHHLRFTLYWNFSSSFLCSEKCFCCVEKVSCACAFPSWVWVFFHSHHNRRNSRVQEEGEEKKIERKTFLLH